MKFQLLFSLFFAFLVNSINSQTYKLEYAQKLSGQFNFVEAYPVWEDLSNVFLKKQKGDWEYLRQAAKAAEKSDLCERFCTDMLVAGHADASIYYLSNRAPPPAGRQ